ncbi:hypothetical protein D3C86_1530840 [compost metagenome]
MSAVSRPSSPKVSPGWVNWLATAVTPARTTATLKAPVPMGAGPLISNGRRNHGSSITTPRANHSARRGTSCHQSRPTSHSAHRVLANSTSAYRPSAARRAAISRTPLSAMPIPASR